MDRLMSKAPAMYQGILKAVFMPLMQDITEDEISKFLSEVRILLLYVETGDKP